MDAVYVALREKAAAEKGEPAASELQASPSLRKVHGQAPAPPKPVTEGEYDAESGGYAADPVSGGSLTLSLMGFHGESRFSTCFYSLTIMWLSAGLRSKG